MGVLYQPLVVAFMNAVVIQNNVKFRIQWIFCNDTLHEIKKLDSALLFRCLSMYAPCGHL